MKYAIKVARKQKLGVVNSELCAYGFCLVFGVPIPGGKYYVRMRFEKEPKDYAVRMMFGETPNSFAGELKYSYKRADSLRYAIKKIAEHTSLREFLRQAPDWVISSKLRKIEARIPKTKQASLEQFPRPSPRVQIVARKMGKP